MRNRRRGLTLIEMMIACFIGLLVMSAAITLSVVVGKDVDRDESSFSLDQELSECVTYLQHDLRYTTLASVRAYPRDDGQPSGASMLAAEPLGEFGRVEMSQFGSPRWQKHVFYSLTSNGDGTARLIRYEQPLGTEIFDVVSPLLPWTLRNDPSTRVIAKTVVDRGWGMTGSRDSLQTLGSDPTSAGGMKISFLHKDGSTTHLNPSEDDPTLSTGLVQIELQLVDLTDLGKISMMPFQFRVYPRN